MIKDIAMPRVTLGGGDKGAADPQSDTLSSRVKPKPGPSGDGSSYDDETIPFRGAKGSSTRVEEDEDEATLRFGASINASAAKRQEEVAAAPIDVTLAGWLVVVSGPGRGSALVVRRGLNKLGRDPASDIALTFGDETISSFDHCRVIYDPRKREFSAQNGDGRNLTYVDEELAIERRLLKRGASIAVGNTVLRFVPFCDESFDWSA